MSPKKSRREILKSGIAIGTTLAAGCVGFGGCNRFRPKTRSAAASDRDYSRISYCCQNCDECTLYKATIDKDDKTKMELAKKWGNDKKPNFSLEKYYCYGCKDRRSTGIPGEGCTVRDCAVKKGYATCAQCGEFETCDKEFWKRFPMARGSVRTLKAELGIM